MTLEGRLWKPSIHIYLARLQTVSPMSAEPNCPIFWIAPLPTWQTKCVDWQKLMILTKLRFGCAILDWTECLCANKRPDRQNYRNYPFVINHISLQAYNHNLHPCKSEQKIVLISARLKSPKPWGEIEGQKELALHWSLGWNRWFRGISPEIGQPGSSYCPLWTSNRLFVLQDCFKWAYSKIWEKMQQQFIWGCMHDI